MFTKSYPNFSEQLLCNLQETFPYAKIEKWTHFFRHDRSVRFLLEISEHDRYILQISIFKYFCVYKRPCVFNGDHYSYGETEFINKGENPLADRLYHCLPNYFDFPWIDREKLKEVVPSLSLKTEDSRFSFFITVADALFSDHYL